MASKSKRRRRVLGASCILAALIVAGSSFAWFTSKDEVTNRLTATADYGVSIVEDFTPPKDMTPGQTVNKDVSVVNTGSIDSLIRVAVTNEINASRLSSRDLDTKTMAGTTYYTPDAGGDLTSKNGNVSNQYVYTAPDADEGYTRVYDILTFGTPGTALTNKAELVELSTYEKTAADGTVTANEVTTLMAGGTVVVAESKSVAPDKQAVRSGDDLNGANPTASPATNNTGFDVIYTDGTKYYMLDSGSYYEVTKDDDGIYSNKADSASNIASNTLTVAALVRDYSGTGQYEEQGTGLYLFKRSVHIKDNTTTVDENDSTTHSGFYYDETDKKFYALNNEKADATGDKNTAKAKDITVTYDENGVVTAVEDVQLLTKEDKLTNSDGTWTVTFLSDTDLAGNDTAANVDPNVDATYLKATYHVDADDNAGLTNADERNIVYYIKLDDDWTDNWTFVVDNTQNGKDGTTNEGLGYFYYNTKLDSGITSKKLIDSVTLSGAMTTYQYLDMTYDLNLLLDSVQVTKDELGNETVDAANANWTNVTATADKGGDGIIDTIDWATT